MGATARNRRCYRRQNGRSMPLGTVQDTGKGLTRPFDHRVTHDGHGKTAKAAEEALRAQNRLSAEAPLPPNSLSMHLGHAPRCGTVCPHTLSSAVTHGARRQGPKGGPTQGGYSTIYIYVPRARGTAGRAYHKRMEFQQSQNFNKLSSRHCAIRRQDRETRWQHEACRDAAHAALAFDCRA